MCKYQDFVGNSLERIIFYGNLYTFISFFTALDRGVTQSPTCKASMLTLASCCLDPIRTNSVLSSFSLSRSDNIHSLMSIMHLCIASTERTYTAISIKVVHEQRLSGKVEYERERLLGIALKIHLIC